MRHKNYKQIKQSEDDTRRSRSYLLRRIAFCLPLEPHQTSTAQPTKPTRNRCVLCYICMDLVCLVREGMQSIARRDYSRVCLSPQCCQSRAYFFAARNTFIQIIKKRSFFSFYILKNIKNRFF